MSIYAAPTNTFEATVSNAPTALTGTLGVRIMDGQGNTTLARTTTGIVESPAGSGIYTATLTAPATAGTYWITWDTGDSSVKWAEEDLQVTFTAPTAAISTGNLTSLANVRLFLQKRDQDTSQDTAISALLAGVTAAIETYCQREFLDRGVLTRRFTWNGGPLRLSPYDLRAATTIVVNPDQSYAQTLTALTDYTLRPVTPKDGTYGWVRIIAGNGPAATWTTGAVPPFNNERLVDITGTWGMASVPPAVIDAANITAKERLEAVNSFNPGLSEDLAAGDNVPGYLAAIPYAARMLLAPYRRADVP